MNSLKRHNIRVSGAETQPMLFAHGFGCDQTMWRYVAPSFEKDYRVILFDHIGAGGSDKSTYSRGRYSSLEAYADDVLAICRELSLRDVVFVGHSVSAMIGVLAAAKQPEFFDRLILVAPSPRYIHDEGYVSGFSQSDIDGLLELLDSNFMAWSSMVAPTIMGNPDRPELGAELTASFCRTDPQIARHFARVTFLSDNRADLPRLKRPSLILQCSQDAIAPDPVGEYMHKNLAGSQLVRLQATGHCPNLSAPEETAAAIRRFLNTQPAS
ncbi:MAG: alpha/beta hydrolase [Polyangia bacterium]